MIVKKLTASFGVLRGRSLELHGGLNIVEAPNESGKTTWCAFIKAMLYGIDTSERNKAGVIADKTKYLPFSGDAMEGSMTVEYGERDMVIERSGTARSPMSKTAVYYADSGSDAGISPADLGEVLVGASRPVFERSAFISGASMRISNTPELEKKIASLALTGDENSSVTEAEERLRKWKNRRSSPRAGEMQKLSARLREIDDALEASSRLGKEEGRYRDELSMEELSAEKLRGELRTHSQLKLAASARRAAELKREAYDAERRYEEVRSRFNDAGAPDGAELSRRRDGLASAKARVEALNEKLAGAEKDVAALRSELDGVPASDGKPGMSRILQIVCTAGFALFTVLKALGGSNYLLIPAAVLLVAAIVMFFVSSKASAERRRNEERRIRIEERLREAEERADSCRAALKAAEDERSRLSGEDIDGLERLIIELRTAELDMRSAKELAESVKAPETANVPTEKPRFSEEETERRLRESEARAAKLREACSIAVGRQQSYGDPAVLRSEKLETEKRLDALRDQCEAIDTAMAVLEEAGEEMRTRFSPQIARLTGEYMSRLTGGRYRSASIDEDFNMLVTAEGDVVSHPHLYLSAGTLDQVYLALRLAISVTVLSENCPIILDDALITFDDERMRYAVELLKELAESRQIILFTCQSRESGVLGD